MLETVVVTGGGGYVGSVLCEQLLLEGYNVVAFDNFFKGNCDSLLRLCGPNFKFIEGDVTDKEFVKNIVKDSNYVIHLAALVGYPICERNKVLAHEVNTGGTKNIVETLNGQRLVFASTGSVYGRIEGICNEDSP